MKPDRSNTSPSLHRSHKDVYNQIEAGISGVIYSL